MARELLRLVGCAYFRGPNVVDLEHRRSLAGARARRSVLRDRAVVAIARAVMVIVRLRFRVRVTGHVPSGGAVAVSVHRSYWDGPVVAVLHPVVVPVTSEHFRSVPGVSWFLRHYGVIWTRDDAVADGIGVVRGGGICWLAPHGLTRDGEVPGRGKPGAARIALATGRPVVGVHLHRGTRGPRPSLTIHVTEPLWPRRDDEPAAFTDRITRALLGTP